MKDYKDQVSDEAIEVKAKSIQKKILSLASKTDELLRIQYGMKAMRASLLPIIEEKDAEIKLLKMGVELQEKTLEIVQSGKSAIRRELTKLDEDEQKDAIGFAEWIEMFYSQVRGGTWFGSGEHDDDKEFTTTDLYELYLKKK